jgi:ComF family protein
MAGQMRRRLLAVVFPPRCQACGVLLADAAGRFDGQRGSAAPLIASDEAARGWLPGFVHQVMAPWLCPDCGAKLETLDGPICTCCGQAFASRQVPDHVCGPCLEKAQPYDRARAVFGYNDTLRRLVHQLKFHDRLQLSRPLGRLLLAYFLHAWKDRPIDIVAPVPLHPRRFRQRGFNQAWLLVRDWEKTAAGNGAVAWRVHKGCHQRVKWQRPQTGLPAGERVRNIKGAFALGPGQGVQGRGVLLVDDVMTTGATAGECARQLRLAGARTVDVLTLARVDRAVKK